MKRYDARVIVYPEGRNADDCGGGGERLYTVIVTAADELRARRLVLERAWGQGFLVRAFEGIEERVK